MDNRTDDNPAIDEELWRAWVEKGKLRDKATARKLKVLAGIVLALGTGFYISCQN